VVRCETCSGVRFPTEVNRDDKHRIRTDRKPERSVKDELREMPDVAAGVDTKGLQRWVVGLPCGQVDGSCAFRAAPARNDAADSRQRGSGSATAAYACDQLATGAYRGRVPGPAALPLITPKPALVSPGEHPDFKITRTADDESH
jgi:hypothetical protein